MVELLDWLRIKQNEIPNYIVRASLPNKNFSTDSPFIETFVSPIVFGLFAWGLASLLLHFISYPHYKMALYVICGLIFIFWLTPFSVIIRPTISQLKAPEWEKWNRFSLSKRFAACFVFTYMFLTLINNYAMPLSFWATKIILKSEISVSKKTGYTG